MIRGDQAEIRIYLKEKTEEHKCLWNKVVLVGTVNGDKIGFSVRVKEGKSIKPLPERQNSQFIYGCKIAQRKWTGLSKTGHKSSTET